MKIIGFFDKVLGKIDKLDAKELQAVLQRLLKEKGFLETLFDTIEDGIIVLDGSGKIIYFNSAATKLIGLESSKDIGKKIQTALPFIDWETINPVRDPESKRIARMEFEVDYPVQRQLRLYATPVEAHNEASKQVALILHDITELKKKTVEEVESERLRALTMLGGMLAHEIGNPLNALSIHTQLIQREIKKIRKNLPAPSITIASTFSINSAKTEAVSNEMRKPFPSGEIKEIEKSLNKLEEYTKIVSHEIDRLDIIVKQYLQALRPTPPKLVLGNLNVVARETIELLYPEIEKRQIILNQKYASDIPFVAFDASQIKQALTNLIKNALQAMTKNGVLTIETGYTDNDVWVAISDTGAGISQEKMKRLFEPFYTTKEKGSGLGLMIVQRIVRDHRGRIEVESKPGGGTTFRIRLPLLKKLPPMVESKSVALLISGATIFAAQMFNIPIAAI